MDEGYGLRERLGRWVMKKVKPILYGMSYALRILLEGLAEGVWLLHKVSFFVLKPFLRHKVRKGNQKYLGKLEKLEGDEALMLNDEEAKLIAELVEEEVKRSYRKMEELDKEDVYWGTKAIEVMLKKGLTPYLRRRLNGLGGFSQLNRELSSHFYFKLLERFEKGELSLKALLHGFSLGLLAGRGMVNLDYPLYLYHILGRMKGSGETVKLVEKWVISSTETPTQGISFVGKSIGESKEKKRVKSWLTMAKLVLSLSAIAAIKFGWVKINPGLPEEVVRRVKSIAKISVGSLTAGYLIWGASLADEWIKTHKFVPELYSRVFYSLPIPGEEERVSIDEQLLKKNTNEWKNILQYLIRDSVGGIEREFARAFISHLRKVMKESKKEKTPPKQKLNHD